MFLSHFHFTESVSRFSYGAGHYTQVVWADTEELGCGMVYYEEAPWYKTLVICNYAKGGNWQGSISSIILKMHSHVNTRWLYVCGRDCLL